MLIRTASVVVPIDKLSILVTIAFSYIVFKEVRPGPFADRVGYFFDDSPNTLSLISLVFSCFIDTAESIEAPWITKIRETL